MDFYYWLMNQFSAAGTMEYREWYLLLAKPSFAPPPETFGLAWGIIYPLIAVAFLYTLYLFFVKKAVSKGFVLLFVLNLLLNLTFTATTLATKSTVVASLHIILVLGTLAWLMALAWRRSKVVFVLLLPYLGWGAFATILQLSITALN